MSPNNSVINHNNHNNNNNKPMKICGCTMPTPTPETTSRPHPHHNTHPPSPCDHLYKLTKATLTLCFILTISLLAFAAISTPPSSRFSLPYPTTTSSSSPSSTPSCRFNASDTRPTQPHHLLFSLSGSSKTWATRRVYSQLWWSTNNSTTTRGYVWLDEPFPSNSSQTHSLSGPPVRVSGRSGQEVKAADRLARIIKESFELDEDNIRWFVMGDDDTVFFVENLVSVLSKYDHREMYYVGGVSESVEQDMMHNYETAFGGGGFAVSYPLACELVRILDGCIERYHNFYGSDERVSACVGELGVPLTRHPGFHQLDIRGNPYGLLAAHPVAPLVSLHHLDYVDPLFPGQNQVDSLKRLMQAYHVDPGLIVQQSFCYDHRRKWSLSVSWGYTVQLYPSLVSARVLSMPLQTFHTWRSHSDGPFVFNTRPLKSDPCEKPINYYLDLVEDIGEGKTLSIYKRVAASETGEKCKNSAYQQAIAVDKITVIALKTDTDMWLKAPRRQCCEITNNWSLRSNIRVKIRNCKPRESITI